MDTPSDAPLEPEPGFSSPSLVQADPPAYPKVSPLDGDLDTEDSSGIEGAVQGVTYRADTHPRHR